MQGWHDATQLILQILRDPALNGMGSMCTLVGILLTFLLNRRSHNNRSQEPQSSKRNQTRIPFPSNAPRFFLRDGYHRATLIKEFVNDVDILLVVDPQQLVL
jgi:hypothetical protein